MGAIGVVYWGGGSADMLLIGVIGMVYLGAGWANMWLLGAIGWFIGMLRRDSLGSHESMKYKDM